MQADALILDLDGTLVDSAPDLADAANALLAARSLEPVSLAAVRGMIGDGVARLAARALTARGAAPDSAELPALGRELLGYYMDPARKPKTVVYEGVALALNGFAERGVRLAVCTNKAQAATDMVLAKTGLAPLVQAAIGQDSTPAPKPAADHVRTALAALGNPQKAVMVGDSKNDLAAGRAAGLPVILVSYGYGTPEALAAADAVIDRFADLPAAIAGLPG